jgi:hypothetical protein
MSSTQQCKAPSRHPWPVAPSTSETGAATAPTGADRGPFGGRSLTRSGSAAPRAGVPDAVDLDCEDLPRAAPPVELPEVLQRHAVDPGEVLVGPDVDDPAADREPMPRGLCARDRHRYLRTTTNGLALPRAQGRTDGQMRAVGVHPRRQGFHVKSAGIAGRPGRVVATLVRIVGLRNLEVALAVRADLVPDICRAGRAPAD